MTYVKASLPITAITPPTQSGIAQMSYYIDDASTKLSTLQKRLEDTDLITSQTPLLEDISTKMSALGEAEITSLADLRAALKTTKTLEALSQESGVDAGYLQLLRRAVNGFFPKPRALAELDWLDKSVAASYPNAAAIAEAEPETLYDAVAKANEGAKFYKGKVGLRDMKRLDDAAAYAP